MKKFIKRKMGSLKVAWQKVLHLNDTPEKVALGFAVGAFVGVFPTFWLGGLIIIGLSAVFRLNYVSGLLGSVIIMNPVTTPLFWISSAFLGGLLFPKDAHIVMEAVRNHTIFNSFGKAALIYITGNGIISVVVSVLSYYVVKFIVKKKRNEK